MEDYEDEETDDEIEDAFERQIQASAARFYEDLQEKRRRKESELTVKQVVAAFKKGGVPRPEAKDWEARCYELACAMLRLKLVEGVPRYGHWRGPVAEDSRFYRTFRVGAPIRHGWVEMDDGRICDPTRWVFEAVEPYISMCEDKDEYYDAGGQAFAAANRQPKPVHNPNSAQFTIPKKHPAAQRLREVFGNDGPYCLEEVFWLSNAPLPELGASFQAVYVWIRDHGKAAYIPTDNRDLAELDSIHLVRNVIRRRRRKRTHD